MKNLTLEMIPELADRADFLYLGSPYSKYPDGIDRACRVVCMVAGALVRQRVRLFCPIAHSHAIAEAASIDPKDHAIWMHQDMAFAPKAGGLIITKMKTWEISTGLTAEREEFEAAGKPVWGLDPRVFGIVGA